MDGKRSVSGRTHGADSATWASWEPSRCTEGESGAPKSDARRGRERAGTPPSSSEGPRRAVAALQRPVPAAGRGESTRARRPIDVASAGAQRQAPQCLNTLDAAAPLRSTTRISRVAVSRRKRRERAEQGCSTTGMDSERDRAQNASSALYSNLTDQLGLSTSARRTGSQSSAATTTRSPSQSSGCDVSPAQRLPTH